jgi:hypothetical protein
LNSTCDDVAYESIILRRRHKTYTPITSDIIGDEGVVRTFVNTYTIVACTDNGIVCKNVVIAEVKIYTSVCAGDGVVCEDIVGT